MKNTTRKKKTHTLPSAKTQWAYWMQAIEPKSKELNEAFPDYHPQWVQMSQRFTIRPETFKCMRQLLQMTVTQCAAYLRADTRSIRNWESGASPVPFAEFELLRLVLESIRFKMSHAAWDGWFISEKGVLVSPDLGGRQGQFTPERLNWLSWNTNEAAVLRNEVARLQSKLDETIAANTTLREMFLNNGVTDEVAAMQERINALMSKINTARVIPFASTAIEQLQEKAA